MARTGSSSARARSADGGVLVRVLLLLAAIAAVGAVVLPVNQLTQPGGQVRVGLSAEVAERALTAGPDLPDGVALEVEPEGAQVVLRAFELSWPLRLLTEAPASLRSAGLAVGALLLARLVASVRAGRPFDRRNPRRLELLAVTVAVVGLLGPPLDGLVRELVVDRVGAGDGVVTSSSLELGPLVLAAVLVALARAFRTGVQLTDEVQGLV